MWRSTSSALLLAAITASGCGLQVTNDQPSYSELSRSEQDVVDRVVKELRGFSDQVERLTVYSIANIVDRERIDVSFRNYIVVANLGDDVVHVSIWENLSQAQRNLVKTWFKAETMDTAERYYETFFYRFLVLVQGAKQFRYEAAGVEWTYANLALFSLESDSVRVALAYYQNAPDVLNTIGEGCRHIRSQYDAVYERNYSWEYMRANLPQIVDPNAPTGYMYYLCRWVDDADGTLESLGNELDYLVPSAP